MTYPPEELADDVDDGTMPNSLQALQEAVIGRRIVSVERTANVLPDRFRIAYPATIITLDDGRKVRLVDTSDCCAFTVVDEILLHIARVNHVILGVGTTGDYTTWHIYADLGDVLELTVEWSAGNPFYYGYGFDIQVIDPEVAS